MLAHSSVTLVCSPEGWSTIPLQEKSKLFKIHQFLLMAQGSTYNIEVQQATNGDFLAHADNTSDPHDAIRSCSGQSVEECLGALVSQLESRTKA